MAADRDECPGCLAVLPVADGPVHPYIGSSAACWARYGIVLAREYGDPDLFAVHQLTVDAYAAQHPGLPERRSIQSVALHLMTLAISLDGRLEAGDGPGLHRRMVSAAGYRWLEPPSMEGRMTILDVLATETPREHRQAVRAWAQDVWMAWSDHHGVVRLWIERSLEG